LVGEVGPLGDAHGVAIVSKLGKGYADSGEDGMLKVFRLSDLKVTGEIKVSPDADGVIYDPHTDRVLVVAGDSQNLTIVDPQTDTVVKTVALSAKPEFLAADGHGFAYVNLSDKGAIAKVDLAGGVVTATWPLENCKAPHGLAYDDVTKRLFSGCSNARLVVVDAETGANLANLPIGSLSDAVVVDPARGRVFSANGDGTLSVISEAGGAYRVLRTIPSFFGGRNLTLDPVTGRLFVSHGNMVMAGPMTSVLALKFVFDGLNIATFQPND
jgi:DNA-binding beta-propeller fold protein YncE